MKLLIAFDGSEHARAAIADLAKSGVPEDASAIVIAVADLPLAGVESPPLAFEISRRGATATAARAGVVDALRDAQELAQAGASLVRSTFPRWTVRADVGLGAPGPVISSRAHDLGVDLVVVGARGRSRLARLFSGSVSRHLATDATTSVLVSRHVRNLAGSPVRIIVGIDGSSSSRRAVDAVSARRWPRGTEVHVTAVAETQVPTSTVKMSAAAAWVAETNQARRDLAGELLEESMTVLTRIGVRVSGHSAGGVAERVLCDAAAEFGADSIVIGGDSFASGPSTARDVVGALVTAAPCSVEIVR